MQTTTYCESYALQAPIMRLRHKKATLAQIAYATADVLATIELHPGMDTAYCGKLWAELDALRDARAALLKKAASYTHKGRAA